MSTVLRPMSPAETRVHADLVRAELDRLRKGDQFKNSRRCQSLLTYLVEEALADRADQLKERTIGVHVFGRTPTYDTAEDPVVRNAAIEVRRRLAQFYMESNPTGALRIFLHAGRYAPEFRYTEVHAPPIEPLPETHAEVVPDVILPTEPAGLPGSRTPRSLAVFVTLLVVCGIAAFGVLRYLPSFRRPGEAASVGHAAEPSAGDSFLLAAAASGEAIRILAGREQSRAYTDRFGDHWSSDQFFSGGQAVPGVTDFFFPPADPALYRNMREGSFTYDIPLKQNTEYEMRLYFAERQYRYGNKVAGDGENVRTFQVRANGNVLLDRFDIIEDSGFAASTVRAFKNISAGADGKLHLQLVAQRDKPLLSAIELLPMVSGAMPPIRIHMSPSQYTDHNGGAWSADNFYIGGQQFESGQSVSETSDPDLFSIARFGNFSYAIPVPPGRYQVTLYFAETWFHEPGRRVFDVTCNGSTLLSSLDIFKQVGFGHVFKKSFHDLQPNGQGKLLISFSPRLDYASISALEVTAQP